MFSLTRFEVALSYWQLYLDGVICTVLLSALAVVLGFLLALLLALQRMSKVAVLRGLATAYVEIIRATPMVVQIWIVYAIMGQVANLPRFLIFGIIRFERFLPGVVALSLNSGAYLCEIIRSGISSIPVGQTEAARSLGLPAGKTMRLIILPQAIRNILPAMANEFVTIIKESSITYVIGVQEIMSAANNVKGATYSMLEGLVIAALLYFCLCFPTSKLIAHFERKMGRGYQR